MAVTGERRHNATAVARPHLLELVHRTIAQDVGAGGPLPRIAEGVLKRGRVVRARAESPLALLEHRMPRLVFEGEPLQHVRIMDGGQSRMRGR